MTSAALVPHRVSRTVVVVVRSENALLLFSDETFDEFRSRLQLQKFDRYISHEIRFTFLAQIQEVSGRVSITGKKLGCRDPNDDMLLETALVGKANCLVTGDHDLLVVSPFQAIPILTPADFLDFLTVH